MGRYELQVLDSYDNPTYVNGQAGSIYKQHIPLVNASRKPGEWQVYDHLYRTTVLRRWQFANPSLYHGITQWYLGSKPCSHQGGNRVDWTTQICSTQGKRIACLTRPWQRWWQSHELPQYLDQGITITHAINSAA